MGGVWRILRDQTWSDLTEREINTNVFSIGPNLLKGDETLTADIWVQTNIKILAWASTQNKAMSSPHIPEAQKTPLRNGDRPRREREASTTRVCRPRE
jgi:hypothetical protein